MKEIMYSFMMSLHSNFHTVNKTIFEVYRTTLSPSPMMKSPSLWATSQIFSPRSTFLMYYFCVSVLCKSVTHTFLTYHNQKGIIYIIVSLQCTAGPTFIAQREFPQLKHIIYLLHSHPVFFFRKNLIEVGALNSVCGRERDNSSCAFS